MTDPRGAVIFLICLGVLTLLLLLSAIVRRLWWTEFVQERKLRWTGQSSYLPYLPFRGEWTPGGRHPRPSAPGAGGGSLVGGDSHGNRRMPPTRAQTPAAGSPLVAGHVPVSTARGADTGTSLAPDTARSVPGADVAATVPTARSSDAHGHPTEYTSVLGGVAPQLATGTQCAVRRAPVVVHHYAERQMP